MPTNKASKYLAIIQDPDVARWVRNLQRGSPVTSEVEVRRLGKAGELLQLSPREMISEARRNLKGLQDCLEDVVTQLEASGKSPGYTNNVVKTVRAWLRYNDLLITRRIKIKNSTATPTIENEQIPSREELAKLFRNSTSGKLRAGQELREWNVDKSSSGHCWLRDCGCMTYDIAKSNLPQLGVRTVHRESVNSVLIRRYSRHS